MTYVKTYIHNHKNLYLAKYENGGVEIRFEESYLTYSRFNNM